MEDATKSQIRDTLANVVDRLRDGWLLRLDAPHGMESMNVGAEAKDAVAYAVEKHLRK